MMTNTEVSSRLLGSAWPQHMNKTLAEGPTKRVQPAYGGGTSSGDGMKP